VPIRKTPLGAAVGESIGKCFCRIEDALRMLKSDPTIVGQNQGLCLPVEQGRAEIQFQPLNQP
jgi:hypothetical protein